MILTCSSCSTRYSINAASIGPEGRLVKCAKCGHKWREFPPEDQPKQVVEAPVVEEQVEKPEPPAESAPEQGMSIEEMTRASQRRAQQQVEKKKRKSRWLGWLLFILILVGIGVGGFYGRDFVVQFWPGSAKFYQMLKLDVKTANKLGLEILDTKNTSIIDDGVVRLTVTGRIKNITGQVRPIPRIGIQLIDSEGAHVYSWSTAIEAKEVAPWSEVEFSSSMNQPPEEAKHVRVHLIAPKTTSQDQ